MKTKGTIIYALVLLFTTSLTATSQHVKTKDNTTVHQISILVNPDNTVALRADNIENERSVYLLNVCNEKGDLVFSTNYFKKGNIIISYDLSELPDGEYEFIVYHKHKPVYKRNVTKNTKVLYNDVSEMLVQLCY